MVEQIAHTETPTDFTSGKLVRFINISLPDEGGAKLSMRSDDGRMTSLEMTEDEWQTFAARVAKAVR